MSDVILIVDDDPVQRRLLETNVTRLGYGVKVAEGGDEALRYLADASLRIDLIILDLVMPDLDGMGVMARLKEMGVQVPVIVQTASGGIDTVVSAMRAGAADFVVKPVGAERLQVSIHNALKARILESELRRVTRAQTGTLSFKDVITSSSRMVGVLRLAEKAAGSQIPILLEGESGVGKELVARSIHGSSSRKSKPFVAVNCGAIPENLVESLLFGPEKGSFTGATDKHAGKFLEADGGTLFLDEVGELPPNVQVKLLRAIQEGEIDPVGSKKPVKVDIRIISATNRLLLQEVQAGRFREDLYYRLGVFPITLPPLRERPEDIPDLIRHFLVRFCAEEGKRIRSVSAETMRMLQHYKWPGNVRQLENSVFRAVVLAESDELTQYEFPQIALQAPEVSSPLPVDSQELRLVDDAPSLSVQDEALDHHLSSLPSPPMPGVLRLIGEDGEVRPMVDIEREAIRFALSHYHGQMTEVAKKLDIGRSTLYRKLKELGLEDVDGLS